MELRRYRQRHRLYVSGYTGTLWRSTDGGQTWQRADRGLHLGRGQAATLAHLQADPRDPRVVCGDGFGGLYKTSDGGDTWRRLDRDLPTSLVCLMALNRPTGDNCERYSIYGSCTHLMMPVGSLSAIYSETASHTRLRRPVSPLARLWGVLPADCRATRSSPERRQHPHHQMCA